MRNPIRCSPARLRRTGGRATAQSLVRRNTLVPPAGAVPRVPMPTIPAGDVALSLDARFGKDAAPITGGLTWRVYSALPDAGGEFRLIKEDKSPAPTLALPPGVYVVHVGFGLATAVRPVTLALRDGARAVRPAGRRLAARGPGRRCAHSARTDFVRRLSKAASSSPATGGRSPSTC